MLKKHIIFDLDNTLTESRGVIKPDMASAIGSLVFSGKDVVVITGAQKHRADIQLGDTPNIILMTQCGNMCAHWENKLSDRQKDKILHHIYSIKTSYPFLFEDVKHEDLIEDRGCAVVFSLAGHHAASDIKKEYDPHGVRRQKILQNLPFIEKDIKVQIGGTTSFDYALRTKGQNLDLFIKVNDWDKKDCLYVGDALFENGNDSSVIGIMDTQNTSGPDRTLEIIKDILKDK